MKLTCTDEEYHELSKAAGNARDGSKFVKVEIAALAHLIADHGKLIQLLGGETWLKELTERTT